MGGWDQARPNSSTMTSMSLPGDLWHAQIQARLHYG
jgi:hypothetical protein